MFVTPYAYQISQAETRTTSVNDDYYILPTHGDEKITWDLDKEKQKISLIPTNNSLTFDLDLMVKTVNHLPNDCYFLNLVFGDVLIENANLEWVTTDKSSGITEFKCNKTVLVKDQQFSKLISQSKIPLQIRFALNKKPIEPLGLSLSDVDSLDEAMQQSDNLNFSLSFANFFSLCDDAGYAKFVYRYDYEDGKWVSLTDNYYYKIMFPHEVKAFETIKDVFWLLPAFGLDESNIDAGSLQFEFIYHDNNFPTEPEKRLTITEPKHSTKSYKNHLFFLPESLQYKPDGKLQPSDHGSGFFLPYGGDGKLLVTLDFNLHDLPKKIVWEWKFAFKSSVDNLKITLLRIFISDLTGFRSYGANEDA